MCVRAHLEITTTRRRCAHHPHSPSHTRTATYKLPDQQDGAPAEAELVSERPEDKRHTEPPVVASDANREVLVEPELHLC